MSAHVYRDRGHVQVVGLGALCHGTEIDVVLVQSGISVTEQDSSQLLGMCSFQVLRDGRTVGQPTATACLMLPDDHCVARGFRLDRGSGGGGGVVTVVHGGYGGPL